MNVHRGGATEKGGDVAYMGQGVLGARTLGGRCVRHPRGQQGSANPATCPWSAASTIEEAKICHTSARTTTGRRLTWTWGEGRPTAHALVLGGGPSCTAWSLSRANDLSYNCYTRWERSHGRNHRT
jgi:hypothetical protein